MITQTQNNTNKALYCYFGELGFFDNNIPGHSFYQIGLLDSLSEKYSVIKFDFYNYIDTTVVSSSRPKYSTDKIGKAISQHADFLIDQYRLSYSDVIKNINNRVYDKLFLKARFRNLSTLEQRIKDATRFETIIQHAISCKYDPSDIVVIDTDMSLSEEMIATLSNLKIKIEIPSITIPGISRYFLGVCMDIHKKQIESAKKPPVLTYHGNLDSNNYKQGHSKNQIIFEIIESVNHEFTFDQTTFELILATKITDFTTKLVEKMPRVKLVPRQNRELIWAALSGSLASINVSKDLYLEKNFIPARVYEAIMAGIIPVSYKQSSVKAMSFDTVNDFFEICKFLKECSPADYFKVFSKLAEPLGTL